MKLDIVVCYSILEYCFENANPFERDNQAILILKEIEKHSINLNDDLLIDYEDYFDESIFLDMYQQWFSANAYIASTKNQANNLSNLTIDAIFTNDYYKILGNLAVLNDDKIIFSQLLTSFETQLQPLGVLQMNIDRILNKNENNHYNNYRLPIIRKRISANQSSANLSQWLSKFLKEENSITIIDGYIYHSRREFRTYFMEHIEGGANVKIITALNHCTEANLISEFTNSFYNPWKIEIRITDKKKQHARNIFTNQYFIHLEKGMAVFGKRGLTGQSDITIDYKENCTDLSMPKSDLLIRNYGF